MQLVSIPSSSWRKVAIDIAGPFKILDQESKFIIIVSDYYSKWIYHKFVQTIDSDTVIAFLECCFTIEGNPSVLVSDNGKQLTSNKMIDFLKQRGICQ